MIANNDIIDVLNSTEAKEFIVKYIDHDLAKINLQFSGKVTFNLTTCLQLMEVYKKARTKLPLFWEQLLAADQRSFQQSTSQKVAQFKSTLISGKRLLDLTGGLGVDDIFFSEAFDEVVSVDSNHKLNELAKHNYWSLEIKNVSRKTALAEDVLNENYDWIYIDPDRRVEGNRKVALDNLKPNVLELIDSIRNCTNRLAIKLSPLFDIDEAVRSLPNVKDIYVISERNEVKEVLVLINFPETNQPQIHAVEIGPNPYDIAFGYRDTKEQSQGEDADLKEFLFQPKPALLKSGGAMQFFTNQGIMPHNEFNIYTAENNFSHGSVRNHKVLGQTSLSAKSIQKMIGGHEIKKVNIVVRGLSDKPEKWHAKLKTTDGGNHFLFILKGKKKEAILSSLSSEQ